MPLWLILLERLAYVFLRPLLVLQHGRLLLPIAPDFPAGGAERCDRTDSSVHVQPQPVPEHDLGTAGPAVALLATAAGELPHWAGLGSLHCAALEHTCKGTLPADLAADFAVKPDQHAPELQEISLFEDEEDDEPTRMLVGDILHSMF